MSEMDEVARNGIETSELSGYEMLQTLGSGTFGRVRLCSMKANGNVFAMKSLRKSELIRLKQQEHIQNERALLMQIEHPFIVCLYRTFQEPEHVHMLLEFVNGGEVFSHLRRAGRFSKEFTKFYVGQIILVFQYLHGLNIVYRDLKPENLLIGAKGYLKITDFGFAKCINKNETHTLCGTPEYLAPEIVQSKGHGIGVDWWALGILTFEMLCGFPPFYDENPYGIYQKIMVGRIEFPKHIDVYGKDFLKRLLTQDKENRMGCRGFGALDLKRHKFFRGVDWNALHSSRIQAPIVPKVSSSLDTHYFDKYPEEDEKDENPPLTPADQAVFCDF